MYGVHRTCAETAAVSRGTSHVTIKQCCTSTPMDLYNVLCTPLRWIVTTRYKNLLSSFRITSEFRSCVKVEVAVLGFPS